MATPDVRDKLNDAHAQVMDYVQKEFGQLLTAVQEAELELVRRCQGCHRSVANFINERHRSIAGKADPEFLRSLDNQAEELTRIVQTRFAELSRDLKQCHGGGCSILNRRASSQIFDMSFQK
jgi:hypothetical protein